MVEHLSVKITVRWCWRAPPGVYFKIDADTPPILVFDRRYRLLCVLLHSWDVSKFSSQLLYLLGGKTIEWNARLKVTEPGMLAKISGISIWAWKYSYLSSRHLNVCGCWGWGCMWGELCAIILTTFCYKTRHILTAMINWASITYNNISAIICGFSLNKPKEMCPKAIWTWTVWRGNLPTI